jgi:hypothetical protein
MADPNAGDDSESSRLSVRSFAKLAAMIVDVLVVHRSDQGALYRCILLISCMGQQKHPQNVADVSRICCKSKHHIENIARSRFQVVHSVDGPCKFHPG